jgi:hypothetical protein
MGRPLALQAPFVLSYSLPKHVNRRSSLQAKVAALDAVVRFPDSAELEVCTTVLNCFDSMVIQKEQGP